MGIAMGRKTGHEHRDEILYPESVFVNGFNRVAETNFKTVDEIAAYLNENPSVRELVQERLERRALKGARK